jgi:hypothetical protein
MANFVLVYTGGSMPATDAERKQVMDAWGAWFGRLGDKIIDMGNPFTQQSKTISNGGSVHEGAVGTQASGYSIIKADSINAAVELAKGCPVLEAGAKVTVYETFPAM